MSIRFDGTTKTIFISSDQKYVDVQRELYSRSVDWIKDNSMFIPPFVGEGGGFLIDLSRAPSIFRFNDKWKLFCEASTAGAIQIVRFTNGLLALQSDEDPVRMVMFGKQYFQNIIFPDQKFEGIASHRQLERDLSPLLEKLHKNQMFLGALYLDIDHFKILNTKLTEITVDAVILPKIIGVLREVIEEHGFLYREGGDEFVCLIPLFDLDQLRVLAERLRESVEVAKIEGQTITVSIGIAKSKTCDDKDVLQRANHAKVKAKEKGRNRVEEFVWSGG